MEIDIPNFINKEIFNDLLLIDKDDTEFLKDLIEMYLDQALDIINNLYNFVKSRNFEEVSKQSHKFKGSSVSIGLINIGLSCEKIENLIKNNSNLSNDNIFIEVTKELVLLEIYFNQAKDFLLKFI
jgi:HPt (histidine-containing phosphotransfer) domain-containing protein